LWFSATLTSGITAVRPGYRFVAGFMGSPPMNMAIGKVVREGDDLAVRLGSATLRLHPAVATERPALAAYVAREVEVVVDTERMHFFGPETGNAIRD
jgi:multiple sugar transport system ATP-binding protein